MTGTAVPLTNRHRHAAHYGTGVPVSQYPTGTHTPVGLRAGAHPTGAKLENPGLTDVRPCCNIAYMIRRTGTMSELLRAALAEGRESLNAIQRATGIKRQSLATFLRGESTLRLDAADKLAAHFGIVCTRRKAR